MKLEEFKNKYSQKVYLGDGLYVYFDGYQFMLTTEREHGEHYIALEPIVFDNLIEYRRNLYAEAKLVEKS